MKHPWWSKWPVLDNNDWNEIFMTTEQMNWVDGFNSRNKIGELDINHPYYDPLDHNDLKDNTTLDLTLTDTQMQIIEVLNELEELLINKNRKYGDSALNPVRTFSNASPGEQLKVRIDDKLSRINSGQLDDTEDVLIDLIGYMVLLIIHNRNQEVQNAD